MLLRFPAAHPVGHPASYQGSAMVSHVRRFTASRSARGNDMDKDHNDRDRRKTAIPSGKTKLTHVSDSGSAHMVSIADKVPTRRVATAKCSLHLSDPSVLALIRANQIHKGDVLGVARVAGIMAAKRTSDLIPLCHPLALSHVCVELGPQEPTTHGAGRIDVAATVACEGRTGVEMEALTAAAAAALTVYDMCKAVDKGMVITDLRVVLKEGGQSGTWLAG